MTEQSAFIAPAFKDSGLPQDTRVENAYQLVKDSARAVGSAQILAAIHPDPVSISAHLLAFASPRLPLADIRRDYSDFAADSVKYIRKIYDKCGGKVIGSGCSAAVESSFVACAIWDTEQLLAQVKDIPLHATIISGAVNKLTAVFNTYTIEDALRSERRRLEDDYLPIASGHMYKKLEPRFRQALNALELKIALPEDKKLVVSYELRPPAQQL